MRLPRMHSLDLVQNTPDTPPVPAMHPQHELVYLLTSGYRTVVRGREYRGGPGDVFLYPCGVPHSARFPHDMSIRLWVLKWTGGLDFAKREHALKTHDASGHLLMLLNWMWQLRHAEDANDRRIQSLLFRLTLEEHARLGREAPSTAAGSLARYITADLSRAVPLEELAAFVQRSPRQVCRIFLRDLGVTPGQFLQRTRAEKAVNLLCGSSLSLKDVARAVGLNSRARFHQLIKRHTGRTPGELRGRWRPMLRT